MAMWTEYAHKKWGTKAFSLMAVDEIKEIV